MNNRQGKLKTEEIKAEKIDLPIITNQRFDLGEVIVKTFFKWPQQFYLYAEIVAKRGFSVFWWLLRSEILLYFERPLEKFERPIRSLKGLNILKTLLKCKETGLVKHISTTDNARGKQTNSDPLDRAVASVCGENNDRTYRGLQSSMQVSEALDVEHVDLVDKQHSGHELRHPLVDVLVHDFVDFGAKFVWWHTEREAA